MTVSKRKNQNGQFLFSSSRRCFCARLNPLAEKSRLLPLSGVIPTNKRMFYRNHSFAKATLVTAGTQNNNNRGDEEDSGSDTEDEDGKKKKKTRKCKSRLRGTKLGTATNRQLEKTIDMRNKLQCDMRAFFVPAVRQSVMRSIHNAKTREEFNTLTLNTTMLRQKTFTAKLWNVFFINFWLPFDVEVPVGCIDIRVGSACDVMCVDTRERDAWILCEAKTNYKDRHKCTSNMMQFPFQDLTDSWLNQHYLQLLLTYYLATKTFPGRKITPYLVRVDDNSVDVDRLPEHMIQRLPLMISKIRNTQTIHKAVNTKPKAKAKAEAKGKSKPK
jgi:hypothetical protein